MLKPVFTLLVLLLVTGIHAQTGLIKLGKKEIVLPERCILTNDEGYAIEKNYIEFKQDTLYYYEVEIDKDGHLFDEVRKFTVPMNAIASTYFRFEHTTSEYMDGRIEDKYNIWINIMDETRTRTAWRYKYNHKGALTKKRQGYVSIYCESRDVYDEIKTKITK